LPKRIEEKVPGKGKVLRHSRSSTKLMAEENKKIRQFVAYYRIQITVTTTEYFLLLTMFSLFLWDLRALLPNFGNES